MLLEKIRKLCVENQMTINALENRIGVSHGTIARWGSFFPRADRLKAAADVLGVTVDELLREE